MRVKATAGQYCNLAKHVESLDLTADAPGEAEEVLRELYAYLMDSRIAYKFDRLAFWCREQRWKTREVLNGN